MPDSRSPPQAPRPLGGYAAAVFCAVYALLGLYVGGKMALEGSLVTAAVMVLLGVPLFIGLGWASLSMTEDARNWRTWLQIHHPHLYTLGAAIRWGVLGLLVVAAVVDLLVFGARLYPSTVLLLGLAAFFSIVSLYFSVAAWTVLLAASDGDPLAGDRR